MGSKSRRKGVRGESEVVAELRPVFGEGVKRGVLQSRDGREVPDVVGAEPFWIESKLGKRTNPKAALEQATEACGDRPYYPTAVCRDDGKKATVTMWLEDWLDVIREWRELRAR